MKDRKKMKNKWLIIKSAASRAAIMKDAFRSSVLIRRSLEKL